MDNPNFKKGFLYLVKALDHFTRINDDIDKIFIEFIGMFVEETEFYFKFCAYWYQEYTPKEKFYSPEFRFILKNCIYEINDLNFQAVKGKFEEILESVKD